MRKFVLLAALVTIASAAQAVYLSPNTGQVLVGPYYTVNDGQETILSVVNTSNDTKAIKVRFLEAVNSRDVLDFNLYMSPFDVWTAKLTSDPGTGGVRIITYDNSCTVPMIPDGGEPFRKIAYDGSMPEYPLDGGSTAYSRLREGHMEIIEMGVADVGNLGAWDHDGNGVADSTHVDSIPESCDSFQANWTIPTGDWKSYVNDTLAPTGGLFGSAAVIDVQEGYEFDVPFTVLGNFSAISLHVAPGTLAPDLRHANPPVSEVRGEDGVLYTDTWTQGIDAVSATLVTNRLFQEYTINPDVEAATAWVISFPTKHEYVDLDVSSHLWPFTQKFTNGKSCDITAQIAWNREEEVEEGESDDFSPMPPVLNTKLCWETNIVNFDGGDPLSSGDTAIDFPTPFRNGWGMVGFGQPQHKMEAQNIHYGLPVIGFRATKLGNSNVGIGATYAVSSEFKYARRVISGSGTE